MVVSNKDSWNSPDYFEHCREDWENIANAALEMAGSAERIDRRSLLERGLSRLPEPALRMAWYLHDLYGVMKERFGQFQMARHYRAVEQAAKDAFRRMDPSPAAAGDNQHTAERFFGWFDRQIDRLAPAPAPDGHAHQQQQSQPPPTPDLER
jgi:MobA/MobL family